MNQGKLAGAYEVLLRRLIIAIVFTVMVLTALCAAGAFAQKAYAADESAGKLSADPAAITASDTSKSTASASKGTTTVYVLTKTTDPKYSRRNESFKYNKYGLLTTYNHYYFGKISIKYDKQMRMKSYSAKGWFKGTIDYDSKGRIAQVKSVNYNGVLMNTAEYSPRIVKYSYNKKNQVSKAVTYRYDEYPDDGGDTWTTKNNDGTDAIVYYSYDKKGRLKKSVSQSGNTTFKYDAKGRVKNSSKYQNEVKTKYNSKGLISSKTYPKDPKGWTYSSKYQYKKIRIPKKYAALVEQQQKRFQGYPGFGFPLLY